MVVASPLNLKKVTTSVNDSQKKVTEARSSVKNIGQVLLKRTKVKRDVFAQTNLFRKRREENERRQTLEDELKAPSVVIRAGGPQELVQSAGVGGFFDRILGFIGYLSAGWIMNNLPTWIAMGKEFVARLQRAGEIVSGFFNNTVKLFVNVGNILGALGQNLLQFDFFDTSNRVKTAISDLNGTMENLTGQIEEAFSLLTTPLTEGKYSGEQIPGVGTQYQDEGAYATPPPYTGEGVKGGNPDFWTLVAIVAREDSDPQGQADVAQSIYNRARSGAYGSSNIRELILRQGQYEPTWQRPKPGKRNIPNPEWFNITDAKSAAKASGFSVSTIENVAKNISNPSLQKSAAEFVQGRTDFKGDSFKFPGGIQRKRGDNYFGWQYGYRGTSVASVPNFGVTSQSVTTQSLIPRRGVSTTVRDEINVSGPSGGTRSVGLSREAGAQYLAPRRGRRRHAGVDIGTSGARGYYVSFRQSGKVTYARNNGGGYGNLVIIQSGNIEFYFAHLARIMVKEGQTYNGETIGEIGNTGGNYPIHLHFEARPNGNPTDPKPYLNLLSIGRQLTGIAGNPTTVVPESPTQPTPARISAPPQQTNMVPFSLTPERRGQDVMVVLPQQQQNIITPVSGGGDMGPSAISDFQLLNNFIKNKLLLDLAYL